MGNLSSRIKEEHQRIKESIEKIGKNPNQIDLTKTNFKEANPQRLIKQCAEISKFAGIPNVRKRQNGKNNEIDEYERIIEDNRQRVSRKEKLNGKYITEYPYCAIGMLQFKENGEEKWGTGTLIGPDIVLTAAHNVMNASKQYMKDIRFLTCLDEKSHEKSVEIDKIYLAKEYENDPKNSKEDYAVLKLKESLEDYGFFGVCFIPYDNLQEKHLSISGYPKDKSLNQSGNFQMWCGSGKLSKRNTQDKKDSMLNYKIFTDFGQSGSSLFFPEKEGYYICGIHNEACPGIMGAGVHINEKRLINIKLWSGMEKFSKHDELDLSSCRITLEGIKYLSKFKLTAITRLHLNNNNIDDNAMKYLSKKDCFPNLKELNLDYNNINNKGINFLKNCNFHSLSHLCLRYNNISHKGMNHLKKCDFPNLTYFNLEGNDLSYEAMYYLKQCYFPNLSYLNLKYNKINDEGIQNLRECSFVNLTHLDLQDNNISDQGIFWLIQSKFLGLIHLNLCENNVTEKGINQLKKSPFKNLEYLNLYNNKITDKGIEYLKEKSFNNLTYLDLYDNGLTAKGIDNLKNCSFSNLTFLNLDYNKISAEGMKYLTDCKFPNLKELYLLNNEITSEGMKHFKDCHFSQLTHLNLRNNKINDEGIDHFRLCSLENLTHLDLWNNEITAKGMQYFIECKFPKLTHLNLGWNKLNLDGFNLFKECKLPKLTDINLDGTNIARNLIDNLNNIFRDLSNLKLGVICHLE